MSCFNNAILTFFESDDIEAEIKKLILFAFSSTALNKNSDHICIYFNDISIAELLYLNKFYKKVIHASEFIDCITQYNKLLLITNNTLVVRNIERLFRIDTDVLAVSNINNIKPCPENRYTFPVVFASGMLVNFMLKKTKNDRYARGKGFASTILDLLIKAGHKNVNKLGSQYNFVPWYRRSDDESPYIINYCDIDIGNLPYCNQKYIINWWNNYESFTTQHGNLLYSMVNGVNSMFSKADYQKYINTKRRKKYAFVTLVMLSDYYVPGAIALAQSIRDSFDVAGLNDIDIVCMVTADVSEFAWFLLSKAFDFVTEVEYIIKKCVNLKTKKQQSLYNKWKDYSLTKWRCLSLDMYEKVLFLDADMIVIKQCDELFAIDTPAATFSSPWSIAYAPNGLYDAYIKDKSVELSTGNVISTKAIYDGLARGFVCIGACVLLQPSIQNMRGFIDFINKNDIYGHDSCFSMIDEQAIAEYFITQDNSHWSFIHQKYNFIPWKREWIKNTRDAKIYHYFNTKPWHMDSSKWPDVKIWWSYLMKFHQSHREIALILKNVQNI